MKFVSSIFDRIYPLPVNFFYILKSSFELVDHVDCFFDIQILMEDPSFSGTGRLEPCSACWPQSPPIIPTLTRLFFAPGLGQLIGG